MKFIFIGLKAYNDLIGRIEKIEKAIISLQRSVSLGSEWLSSDEVCAILRISKRTLQRYRSNRMITFSVVNHKMLYSKTIFSICCLKIWFVAILHLNQSRHRVCLLISNISSVGCTILKNG